MNYYVVINENELTEAHAKASFHSSIEHTIDLGNGQRQLRIENRFLDIFGGYVKYTLEEIKSLVSALRDSNGDLIPNKTITSTQAQAEIEDKTPVYLALTEAGVIAMAKGEKGADGTDGFGIPLNDRQKLANALHSASTVSWIGDSITENPAGYVSKVEQLFPNPVYTNNAVGGWTTKDCLDNIVTFTAQASDLFIVALGVNDVRYNDSRGAIDQTTYLANMLNIVTPLKNTGAKVAVLSIWPSHHRDAFSALLHKETNDRIRQYNKGLSKLCADLDIIFIDAYSPIMCGVNVKNESEIASDGIHPSGAGIELYAEALFNEKCKTLTDEFEPIGKHFFKIKILDHDTTGAGGYCGIKNISTPCVENIGVTANTSYNTTNLFGTYNESANFYNKPYDFPFYLVFSTNTYPTECNLTSIVSGTGYQRGAKSYVVYHSQDPEAFSNLDHPTWEAVNRETTNKGLAVNILPQTRKGVYYMFIGDGTGSLNMKKIKTATTPVRVWLQNIKSTSKQRFVELFNGTLNDSAQGLNGNLPSYVIIWESPTELDSLDIDAFSGLTGFRVKKSYDPDVMDNPVHTSWKQIATGTTAGVVNL